MPKQRRYLIYFVIGIAIYFIIDGENLEAEEVHDVVLPLLIVVLVLIFGLRFWLHKDK